MPLWLKLRLPENQLEESFEDNAAIVKDAFEKYIDERVNNNIQYWKAKDKEPDFMFLTYGITGRLFELAKSKLVPSIRIVNVDDLVIGVGILRELYNRGVTRDQCPNLRAQLTT